MPVETAADRAIMIADFGESVTFAPQHSASYTVTGIFDMQYNAVDAGGSVEFAMSEPRLTVRTADVDGVIEGDEFIIRSLTYVVRIVMSDGTGITELALEAQ